MHWIGIQCNPIRTTNIKGFTSYHFRPWAPTRPPDRHSSFLTWLLYATKKSKPGVIGAGPSWGSRWWLTYGFKSPLPELAPPWYAVGRKSTPECASILESEAWTSCRVFYVTLPSVCVAGCRCEGLWISTGPKQLLLASPQMVWGQSEENCWPGFWQKHSFGWPWLPLSIFCSIMTLRSWASLLTLLRQAYDQLARCVHKLRKPVRRSHSICKSFQYLDFGLVTIHKNFLLSKLLSKDALPLCANCRWKRQSNDSGTHRWR